MYVSHGFESEPSYEIEPESFSFSQNEVYDLALAYAKWTSTVTW